MNKKKVMIVESSITIKQIFTALFDSKLYDVNFVSDSYLAIKELMQNYYEAIILPVDTIPLDAYEVTNIIKQNEVLNQTTIVVYQTEESIMHSFWLSVIGADLLFLLSPESIDQFIIELEQLLTNKNIELSSTPREKISDKDLAVMIAKSSKNEMFQNTINDSLYNITTQVSNLNSLVKSIFDLVEGISGVECMVCEILNGSTVYEYYKTKDISRNEIDTLLKVCHSDFDNYSTEKIDYAIQNFKVDCTIPEISDKKIQSYECFVLYANNFIGTFHVASCVSDIFTDVINSRLTCFSEKAGSLFEFAINELNITTNETKIRKLFSRFVPGEIIDDLIHDDNSQTEFVGEKRKLAVLICDIRDFTSISENNKPENVVSFLNNYFTKMVAIIKKHGGSIDKFMGDAIMALFGAPISYEDNCDRAVRAGLEMTKELQSINFDLLKLPAGKQINVGVGIHYGDVIFGSIGCNEKSDYTVIGDSVNLASRLEGLTKQYGVKIIVSKNVKDNLTDNFFLRHIDNVKVKGKSIAVSIYSVEEETDFSAEYLECYKKGMDLYELGGWKLAREYFEKCINMSNNDYAAKQMANRCKEFENNPPLNWDGAISLTTK